MTRLLASIMLCVAAACTSWHVETVPPQELIAVKQPPEVRVTLLGGRRVVVRHPRLAADTLLGTDITGERKGVLVGPLLRRDGPDTTIGFSVSLIQGIATRRASAGRTVLVVGGILAVTVGVVASMGCMSINASC